MKLRRFLLPYCCSLCLLPFTSPAVYSQNFNADNLLDFARFLFQEGDYLNAVHEYQRYLFLYPDTNRGDFVQLHIAAAYQNAGRLSAAIEAYRSLIEIYPESPFIERARSNIAQCQLLQGNQAPVRQAGAKPRQVFSGGPCGIARNSEFRRRAQQRVRRMGSTRSRGHR